MPSIVPRFIFSLLLLASCSRLTAAASQQDDGGPEAGGTPGPPRVLIVLSAAKEMAFENGERFAAGYWAPEFLLPYRALIAAGYEVDVVTPGGAAPVPDPVSLGKDSSAMLGSLAAIPALSAPGKLEALDDAALSGYGAVIIPGGYSPMTDLSHSRAMAHALEVAVQRGALIAAICHGPAALLSCRREGHPWLFAGYEIAMFTNAEEDEWLGGKKLPWRVEDALREAGAVCRPAANWTSQVVRDRNLITAQSSPSTRAFTQAIVEALNENGGR